MKKVLTLALGLAIVLSGTLKAQENSMKTIFNEADTGSIRSCNGNP